MSGQRWSSGYRGRAQSLCCSPVLKREPEMRAPCMFLLPLPYDKTPPTCVHGVSLGRWGRAITNCRVYILQQSFVYTEYLIEVFTVCVVGGVGKSALVMEEIYFFTSRKGCSWCYLSPPLLGVVVQFAAGARCSLVLSLMCRYF